jgi:hypothetical protein
LPWITFDFPHWFVAAARFPVQRPPSSKASNTRRWQ